MGSDWRHSPTEPRKALHKQRFVVAFEPEHRKASLGLIAGLHRCHRIQRIAPGIGHWVSSTYAKSQPDHVGAMRANRRTEKLSIGLGESSTKDRVDFPNRFCTGIMGLPSSDIEDKEVPG